MLEQIYSIPKGIWKGLSLRPRVRVLFILLAITSGFAVAKISQIAAPQSSAQTRSRHRAMPGGERSIKGCVAKDNNGGYLLVPQRGAKVRLNSGDVAGHEGQQVKLSGAFVDAQEPSDPAKPGQKAPEIREFRVLKVDVLSTTCSVPAGKKKK